MLGCELNSGFCGDNSKILLFVRESNRDMQVLRFPDCIYQLSHCLVIMFSIGDHA